MCLSGFDGKSWGAAQNVFGAVSTNGSAIQTAFTTAAALTLNMRFALGVQNTTGAAIESATISLALVFEFRT